MTLGPPQILGPGTPPQVQIRRVKPTFCYASFDRPARRRSGSPLVGGGGICSPTPSANVLAVGATLKRRARAVWAASAAGCFTVDSAAAQVAGPNTDQLAWSAEGAGRCPPGEYRLARFGRHPRSDLLAHCGLMCCPRAACWDARGQAVHASGRRIARDV